MFVNEIALFPGLQSGFCFVFKNTNGMPTQQQTQFTFESCQSNVSTQFDNFSCKNFAQCCKKLSPDDEHPCIHNLESISVFSRLLTII